MALIPAKSCDVFFAKAARSSFGPANTVNGISFANVLKSGLQKSAPSAVPPRVIQEDSSMDNAQQPMQQSQSPIETMIFTLQQSMMEFMSFMRSTMQNLMQNQNTLIQMLASQQSK
ncbi:uncharacterized protein LOC117794103 [Drosophila innubila]|uniref:uncharacterized protein LOC117794103 n=1 Tax=Drosophila innubila TaxID=198719 RepID=UPI00148E1D8F|nr:uncharacterized protein LOC117794103 [Drosophila innubila]